MNMGDEYQGARKQKKLRTYEAKLAMDFLRMIGGWDGTSNGRSDAAKSKSISVLSPFYPVLLILPFRLCFDSVKHAIPLKAIGHGSIIPGYRRSPWRNCTCIWRDGEGELPAQWRESSLFNAAEVHLRTERPIASSSCQFRAKYDTNHAYSIRISLAVPFLGWKWVVTMPKKTLLKGGLGRTIADLKVDNGRPILIPN